MNKAGDKKLKEILTNYKRDLQLKKGIIISLTVTGSAYIGAMIASKIADIIM